MVPVGMADGYAQITGRPALLNLHTVEPTVAERNAVESKMIRYKYGSGEA